MTKGSSSCSP